MLRLFPKEAAVESSDSGGFSISDPPTWVPVKIPSHMLMSPDLPLAAWFVACRILKDCSRKVRVPKAPVASGRIPFQDGRAALRKWGFLEIIPQPGRPAGEGHWRMRNPEGVKCVWFDAWDHTALRAGTVAHRLYLQLQWDLRQGRRSKVRSDMELSRLLDCSSASIWTAWRQLFRLKLATPGKRVIFPPPAVAPLAAPATTLEPTSTEAALHDAGCTCALHNVWAAGTPSTVRRAIEGVMRTLHSVALACTCALAAPAEAAPPPAPVTEETTMARDSALAAALAAASKPKTTPTKSTLLQGTLEAYDRWVADGAPSLATSSAPEAALVIGGALSRYIARHGAAAKPTAANLENLTAALEELALRPTQAPDSWLAQFAGKRQMHPYDLVLRGMHCFFTTARVDFPLVHNILLAAQTKSGLSGIEQYFLDNRAFKAGEWGGGDRTLPHLQAWDQAALAEQEAARQVAAEVEQQRREQAEAVRREAAAKPSPEQLLREERRRAWIDYLHFKNMTTFHTDVVAWRRKHPRHISYEDECAFDPKEFFEKAGLKRLYYPGIEHQFPAITKEIEAHYVAQRSRFVGRPVQTPELAPRTWDPATIPATRDCPTDLGVRLVGIQDGERPGWDREAVLADLDARAAGRDPRRALYIL